MVTGCTTSKDRPDLDAFGTAIEAGYPFPPVVEGGLGDSAAAQDRRTFSCGSLSGAVTGALLCNRIFPKLSWDFTPGAAFVSISAVVAPGASGADAAVRAVSAYGVVFKILTGARMAPMTVTCATLAPLPPKVWVAFQGGFGGWSAKCNSAKDVVQGSSFELALTSVGQLFTDSLGADPLDASPDGFDWNDAHREIVSNTFHGTFKATLVASNGGQPVYVSMVF
jgi:hypothetical protein